jgi:hypothetical protein
VATLKITSCKPCIKENFEKKMKNQDLVDKTNLCFGAMPFNP